MGITRDFLQFYKETMQLKEVDPRTYSPLVLAYVGDGVYDVMVRLKVVNGGNVQVNKLHKHSSRLVCAGAQSKMIGLLEAELTEEELAVFKRGRNAHSVTSAKNASVIDYRRATGLEALFGYLHLCGETDRARELFQVIWGDSPKE